MPVLEIIFRIRRIRLRFIELRRFTRGEPVEATSRPRRNSRRAMALREIANVAPTVIGRNALVP